MKPEQITEALEQAAAHLGIRVRYDHMTGDSAGSGGLCKIKGQWCVIIDRKTPASDRAAMLVEALAGFNTDDVFLPPKVREALQARRTQLQPKSADDATAEPGAV